MGEDGHVTTLYEMAQVLRSKNAGPFLITIDVMFSSMPEYDACVGSFALDRGRIGELYGVSGVDVRVYLFPQARAIKITLPRPVSSGGVGDRDVYGAQQHGPLGDLEI